LGGKTMVCNTSGINNSAVGYGSLLNNTTGSCNTAMGREILKSITQQLVTTQQLVM
jgi:hypothetical protein